MSIARFSYPEVVGNGHTSVADLLRADPWLAARVKERLQFVPAAGERLPLFEAGFDSHNAVYEDRRELVSAALEDKVEAIARAHPGFFVGRFDVCAASADDLRRGTFEVMELNGVASKPMQIYDPATSVAQALRVLLDQWRAAFAIGAANRARGAELTPLSKLLWLIAREHAIHVASDFRALDFRT